MTRLVSYMGLTPFDTIEILDEGSLQFAPMASEAGPAIEWAGPVGQGYRAALTWRLRLQPAPEGWVDMAFSVPIMDTTRAREELGLSQAEFAQLVGVRPMSIVKLEDGSRPIRAWKLQQVKRFATTLRAIKDARDPG